MRGSLVALGCALAALLAARPGAQTPSPSLAIGRPATAEDIRLLDIDVMPDGRGLPAGRGTAAQGAVVYSAKCASCHGAKGEGGAAGRLAGRTADDRFAFATDASLVRTIGSYWPYATTLYDYTARAMPFQQPGTLSPDETYGLVAYLLFLNGVIVEDAVMDQSSLPKVRMPARDRFVPDNRRGGREVK
jgi:cytochrome c